jgi:nuclease-like protein
MPKNSATTPGGGWRVKYDGVCSRCGTSLRAGEIAVYDRRTRSVRCVICPVKASDQTEDSAFDSGVAGASSRREYDRRKANREARVRARLGRRLGAVVLAVTDDPQTTRAWGRGADGEERLAKALEGVQGLRALHDRSVPGTRANIDHIFVAPAGLFVVDAKNYRGRIELRDRGSFLHPDHRLYVGRRDCSSLATGLGWQVAAVAAALAAAGVDPLPPVTPVLCFVDGEWPLLSPPESYAGVRLESTKSLHKLLAGPQSLEAPSIELLSRLLSVALPASKCDP